MNKFDTAVGEYKDWAELFDVLYKIVKPISIKLQCQGTPRDEVVVKVSKDEFRKQYDAGIDEVLGAKIVYIDDHPDDESWDD